MAQGFTWFGALSTKPAAISLLGNVLGARPICHNSVVMSHAPPPVGDRTPRRHEKPAISVVSTYRKHW